MVAKPDVPTSNEPTKLLYRRREAAEVLSVSSGTVDNLVKRGQLRPVYVGKLPMFSRMELERFCRNLEQNQGERESSDIMAK